MSQINDLKWGKLKKIKWIKDGLFGMTHI